MVISQEERVAKKTDYSKKKPVASEHKKLRVDKEASGVEVRKVSVPAIQKNDVKTSTAETTAEVVEELKEVAEMDYKQESTDVGSSTQAQTESSRILSAAKKDTKKVLVSASEDNPKISEKKPVVISGSAQDQDGVVVRKVSKISEESVSTQEGITSKVTVGSGGDIDPGDVVFESNSDVTIGEATFSKTEDTVTDLSGINDMDIDINGILDGV
jgi:sensor c-di-GMP phosphodiesterase-like protein